MYVYHGWSPFLLRATNNRRNENRTKNLGNYRAGTSNISTNRNSVRTLTYGNRNGNGGHLTARFKQPKIRNKYIRRRCGLDRGTTMWGNNGLDESQSDVETIDNRLYFKTVVRSVFSRARRTQLKYRPRYRIV